MTGFWSIVVSIFVLGVIVLVHELGHYIAGKLLGFRILEFAIGFGPKILTRQGKQTRFSLRLLPLGGYCRFEGEDESPDPNSKTSFNAQPVWKRFIATFSGAFMNILFALVLATVVLGMYGGGYKPIITAVEPQSPAAQAGIQAGDIVREIDGKPVEISEDIITHIVSAGGQEVSIALERDGQRHVVQMTPFYDDALERYRVGISTGIAQGLPLGQSIARSFELTWSVISQTFSFLIGLIFRFEGAEHVGGPIMIVSTLSSAAQEGIRTVLMIALLISINLGVFNLIPFPALDGGRLLFLVVEGVRGKPFDRQREGLINLIGLIVLLGLFVVFGYRDIVRLIGGGMP